MFPLRNLQLHVEITSNCNSRCLDCGRYVKGSDIVNPWLVTGAEGNMRLEWMDNIFDDAISANIRAVNFTGTYGEATLHPRFFEILELIADKVDRQADERARNSLHPRLSFLMETNGGLHSTEWWSRLGRLVKERFSPSSKVFFGIDGIDDETHQKYRRGVDFDRVVANARAFASEGNAVVWSMIVFEHNESQVDSAKKMAEQWGFAFKIRRSRLRHQTSLELPNVIQKKAAISTEVVRASETQMRSLGVVPSPQETLGSIECEWASKNQISVDYTTRVWQCCYFSNFYHPRGTLQGKDNPLALREKEGLAFYENQYDDGWNLCSRHKLSDILNHSFFLRDLPGSLSGTGRRMIHRCQKHCGAQTRRKEGVLSNAYQ